jgi:hypothetical protein
MRKFLQMVCVKILIKLSKKCSVTKVACDMTLEELIDDMLNVNISTPEGNYLIPVFLLVNTEMGISLHFVKNKGLTTQKYRIGILNMVQEEK